MNCCLLDDRGAKCLRLDVGNDFKTKETKKNISEIHIFSTTNVLKKIICWFKKKLNMHLIVWVRCYHHGYPGYREVLLGRAAQKLGLLPCRALLMHYSLTGRLNNCISGKHIFISSHCGCRKHWFKRGPCPSVPERVTCTEYVPCLYLAMRYLW